MDKITVKAIFHGIGGGEFDKRHLIYRFEVDPAHLLVNPDFKTIFLPVDHPDPHGYADKYAAWMLESLTNRDCVISERSGMVAV